MSAEEIRQRFLAFFKERGHTIVPSSSLLPDDPSVLLTTAGMQQFKPYFTGDRSAQDDFQSLNTASIQKSFRTSDIEEVGDERHDTFFEMLGNFSFGGYFKKEAITYAYEFITKEMGLPISYVTIFKGLPAIGVPKDEESKAIWQSLGVKDVREEGIEDVFWGPTGSAGPCGPTTEIYCKNATGQDIEVWNLVFNQFYFAGSREELLSGKSGKKLEPLKTSGVDTGMGLERLAMISQQTGDIFATDLFAPLLAVLPQELEIRDKRVLADHARAAIFLIADGVRPSNKEAGYILRRLIRRFLAVKIKNDLHTDPFTDLYQVVVQEYGKLYPEVKNPAIRQIFAEETAKFEKVVPAGLAAIRKYGKELTADVAFQISSTTGLPFELMQELAKEATKNISQADYEKAFKKHQEISRAGAEAKFGGHGLYLKTGEVTIRDASEVERVTKLHTATHLMHAGLRAVLGEGVRQDGSDITVERTRFDFRFERKVTPEELKKVEAWVNAAIQKDLKVEWKETSYADAVKHGALGFFRAKYPLKVKVYTMLDPASGTVFSKELCGGPHVEHTSAIGQFKILKEEAVSAGVRRIRANIE